MIWYNIFYSIFKIIHLIIFVKGENMNLKKSLTISDLKILDQHIIDNFDTNKTEEKELEVNKDIYWVEGYLCALVSSPEPMIKMDYWLPYINGEDCIFESEQHAHTIIGSILTLKNNIAKKLNDKSYKPLYETYNLKNESKENLITKWAKGYMFATLLFHFDIIQKDENIEKLLLPIIMAADGDFSNEVKRSEISKKDKEKILELIPELILNFYEICKDIRYKHLAEITNIPQKTIINDFKIERNAPCPCGSGKKFKKCCLLNNSLLH